MPLNNLIYTISVNSQQAQQAVAGFANFLRSTVAQAGNMGGNPFRGIQSGAQQARQGVAGLGSSFTNMQSLATAAAVGIQAAIAGKVVGSMMAVAKASAKTETAFRALEASSNANGDGIVKAWTKVQEIVSKNGGVVDAGSVADAITNLRAYGMTLDEAADSTQRLIDRAAYNRQGHLNLAEAVVTTTEGIRNENSQLSDATKMTENISSVLEKAAKKMGLTTAEGLTQQQRAAAIRAWIVQETKANEGDLQKSLKDTGGAIAKTEAAWENFKSTLGGELEPTFGAIGNAISSSLQWLTDLVKALRPIDEAVSSLYDNMKKLLGLKDEAKSSPTDGQGLAKYIAGNLAGIPAVQEAAARTGGTISLYGMKAPNLPPLTVAQRAGTGFDPSKLPPPPPGMTTTLATVDGPSANTRGTKDNINQAAVAERNRKQAEEDTKKSAKARLDIEERNYADIKQLGESALSDFEQQQATKRATLKLSLDKEQMTQAQYADAVAGMDAAQIQVEQKNRDARIEQLQKMLELAKTAEPVITGADGKPVMAAKVADIQRELNTELSARKVAADKIKEVSINAEAEIFEAKKATTEKERRLADTALDARLSSEKTTAQAVAAFDLATLDSLHEQKLITEEDYIRKAAAIKERGIQLDIAQAQARLDVLNSRAGLTKQDQADIDAERTKLNAQIKSDEQQRAQLHKETDSKIKLSAVELAKLQRELDIDLAEAEGKNFEAKAKRIDDWLAQKRVEFAAYPALLAKAEAIADNQKKQNSFDQASAKAGFANGDAQRAKDSLDRERQQGLITDMQYDAQAQKIADNQRQRLQEQLDLMKQFSNGSDEAKAAIAELEQQVAQAGVTINTTAQAINSEFFDSLKQGFKDLLSGTKSFAEVFKNILSSVLSKLADLALNNALQGMMAATGGNTGGLGGFLSSLLGFGGFRANGGPVASGTAYIVGERGPETFIPGVSGSIVSNERLRQALTGMRSSVASPVMPSFAGLAGAGGGSMTSQVTVNPQVVISAHEMLDAIGQLPAFERHITRAVISNGKRIRGGWGS